MTKKQFRTIELCNTSHRVTHKQIHIITLSSSKFMPVLTGFVITLYFDMPPMLNKLPIDYH